MIGKFQSVEKEQDRRLEHGAMMEKLLTYPEFQYYQSILDEKRMEWTLMVLTVDVESKVNRAKLGMIDEVIGIPEMVINKGKQAQREENQEVENY